MAQRVADEVGELGQRLDARIARADEHEGQLRLGSAAVRSGHRPPRAAEDVVAEVDRVREVLEAERVLGEAGDRQHARDRAEREHRLLVADLEASRVRSRPSPSALARSSAVSRPSSSSACGHIIRSGTTTWRGSSVPDAASGRSGVKSMKFSRLTIVAPRAAEQPCDVGAGEAAAEDERSAAGLPTALPHHRAMVSRFR